MQKKSIVHRQPGLPSLTTGQTVFDSSIPPLLQRVYLQRGITSQHELQKSLANLPPPELFKGMNDAITLLEATLRGGHRICVIGDFDADGATSTALATHALRAMQAKVDFLVPNRFEYGYGLTPEIVEEALRLQQPELIITVDNGISSLQGVAVAKQHGVRVIITDHHLPGRELPAADAIVNPNQPACDFPCKNLAGVGVIFYVMSALRKKLRETGYFAERNIVEPRMADYLDLVALGTVADVVRLDFTNRILVQQGLLRIRSGQTRPGIQALVQQAGRNPARLVAEDLAFAVAPRLNAAGRMDNMATGIQCLLSENLAVARPLANALDALNRNRKTVEQGMQQEALAAVEKMHLADTELPWGLCVFDESWHQGVVGLLASRLKERYHRPVIAFAPAEHSNNKTDEMLKGSARSIEGLHIRDVLDAIATEQPGLLEKFGGHAMAAGLSLPKKNLAAFTAAFDQKIREQLCKDQLAAVITSDGELDAESLQIEQAWALRNGGPWGQGFPAPLFHGTFRVVQQRAIGEQHLRLVLQPRTEAGPFVDAIVFFIDASTRKLITDGCLVTIAYRLDVNEYQGTDNLQLTVEHLEPAG